MSCEKKMATGGNEPEQLSDVCRYYGTSAGCWYGDTCRFMHSSSQSASPPVCKFFGSMMGCRYGNNCRFSHVQKTDENNNGPSPVASASPGSSGKSPKSDLSSLAKEKKSKDSENIAKQEAENIAKKEKEAAAKSEQKIIKCSECNLQFANDDKVYEKLQQHYAEQLGKVDRTHTAFFRDHKEFMRSEAMCGVCERSFSRVPHMLNHLGSKATQKAVNKVKRDHQTFLDEVASYFVERDLGLIEVPEMLNMLTMVILTGAEDEALGGMPMYLLKKMAALGRETEEEMEERSENCGFLQDEIDELMCQGIKPWDDCAWDALDVLYDF